MPHESGVQRAPADFGTRFSAFMIDGSILFGAQWIVFVVLARQLQAMGLSSTESCSVDSLVMCEGPSTAAWAILTVLLLVVTIGYHAVFEGLRGATPGKYWMGLRVTGVGGHAAAEHLGLGRGLIRAAIRQLFWLSLFVVLDVSPFSLDVSPTLFLLLPAAGMAGLVLGAVTPSGRALHDYAAGSVVAHASEVAPASVSTPLPVPEDSP
jgi:uncharacterized RDD family membrane protein YckC